MATDRQGKTGESREELTVSTKARSGRPEVDQSGGNRRRTPVMYALKMRSMASVRAVLARFSARGRRSRPRRFSWTSWRDEGRLVAATSTTTWGRWRSGALQIEIKRWRKKEGIRVRSRGPAAAFCNAPGRSAMAGTWPWPWDGRHGHPLPPL